MKKQALSLLVLLALTVAASGVTPPVDRATNVAGTYGVYNQSANPVIQLVLNADGTFHLLDRTDPSKPVDASGTWTMKNNTVRLAGYTSEFPINDKWRTSGNAACISSRRGLEWTRLCRE